WDNSGRSQAPQSGTSQQIGTAGPGIESLVYRNGSLWAVQTISLPADASVTRSAVQWWEISTEPTVKQRGRIDDPAGNAFYGFPSITVNKNNDVLIGYARFSSSQYAGSG